MEQLTGLAWITGWADLPPIVPRGPCDPLAGQHAAFALLVALEERDRTGEGLLLEVPMVEAALATAAGPIVEAQAYGVVQGREGNRGPVAAPQGVYACAEPERWVALAVATDEQWAALCGVLDRADLAADPDLADHAGRRVGRGPPRRGPGPVGREPGRDGGGRPPWSTPVSPAPRSCPPGPSTGTPSWSPAGSSSRSTEPWSASTASLRCPTGSPPEVTAPWHRIPGPADRRAQRRGPRRTSSGWVPTSWRGYATAR